ncbi:hypothetical protein COK29_26870 [Bacillus cereus]|nr:hypothetical protein COK29_26870 [Bacillus cereus]
MNMARKNKSEKPPYHEVVSLLLKKQGISYDAWSKQVVTDICVSALQGENTEWRHKMLEQASIEMIESDILDRGKKNTETSLQQHNKDSTHDKGKSQTIQGNNERRI